MNASHGEEVSPDHLKERTTKKTLGALDETIDIIRNTVISSANSLFQLSELVNAQQQDL